MACLFLCGPAILFGALKAGIAVPVELTAEPAKYLIGGVSQSAILPNLNIDGFANKKLQAAIEDSVGNYVPSKANALLTNAALQRAIITFSDLPQSFRCYPTYFDSSVIYDPTCNALAQKPLQDTKEVQNGIREFAVGFADLVQKFPDRKFVIIVADISNTSLSNPALCLSDDTYTTVMLNAMLKKVCAGFENVSVIDCSYDNPRDYYQYFYRTDHHWNGWGALDAYERSIDSLESNYAERLRGALNDTVSLKGLEWLSEHGYSCRDGLMLINEPVNEPEFSLSEITLEEGSPPLMLLDDGVARMKEAGPIASYDFYQTWYGQWQDTVAVNDGAALPGSSALVVCDSFGTAFKWIASTGFGRVETLYDLHGNRTEATPLAETLLGSDCEIVFLVACAADYQKVLDRFPGYLD